MAKISEGYGSFIRVGRLRMDQFPKFYGLVLALWFLSVFSVDLRHLANEHHISNVAFWSLQAGACLACALLPVARDIRKFLVSYALAYVPFTCMMWHWILKRA